MRQKESKLQLEIRKALEKEFGGFWFKIWGGPFQMVGLPDIIGCCKGKFIAIEVKTLTGRAAKHQLAIIRVIRKAGGLAFVCRSVDHAIRRVGKWINHEATEKPTVKLSRTHHQTGLQAGSRRIILRDGPGQDFHSFSHHRKIMAKKRR